jgi:hypothetical protein
MTVDQLGRAYQAYRRTTGSRSMAALLIANDPADRRPVLRLEPDHDPGHLLLENGIVGFWNVPRILLAQGSVIPTIPPPPDAAALAATGNAQAAADLQAAWQKARDAQLQANAGATAAPGSAAGARAGPLRPGSAPPAGGRRPCRARGLLLFHYGCSVRSRCLRVHAAVVPGWHLGRCIDGQSASPGDLRGSRAFAAGPFGEILWTNVAIAGVALFLSHGASFLFNYIGRASTSPRRRPARWRPVRPRGRPPSDDPARRLRRRPRFAGRCAPALVGLKTAFDLARPP